MLKFFKNQFGMIVSIVIAVLLSLCMAATATIRAVTPEAPLTIERLISNWGTAFLVIMLISIVLPSKLWGDHLAGALHLKPDFLPFGLVSNLVPTLFYNTGATLVLVGVNVGFTAPYYWAAVAGDLVFMYIVSYVLSLIAERIGMLIAKRVFNEKDRQLDMRDLPHV